jgi:polar amino acid transport system ATP-binding protein
MKVKVDHLTKTYDTQNALNDVTLDVPENVRTLALIGPSGGGKSTLLRILGGLETPTSGTIRINDQLVEHTPAALLKYRRSNGFLFQSFNLFPHLSALQNVALPLEKVHNQSHTQAQKTAQDSLARFGLADHSHKMPSQMSGGQQQRVALARAIAHQPRLLILDEPTSALDPEMTAEVLEFIDDLRQGGQEIILSTHEMGFARAAADEIIFLAEGQILQHGPPNTLFENSPIEPVNRFLARVMRY